MQQLAVDVGVVVRGWLAVAAGFCVLSQDSRQLQCVAAAMGTKFLAAELRDDPGKVRCLSLTSPSNHAFAVA